MRIYPSPVVNMNGKPHFCSRHRKPHRERFGACEVPQRVHFFHIRGLLMPFRPNRFSPLLPMQNDGVAAAPRRELQESLDRQIESSASR
jgi:hypothetical protein